MCRLARGDRIGRGDAAFHIQVPNREVYPSCRTLRASRETGINRPASSPFKLLDFELLVLGDGEAMEAAIGDREVLAVVLGGKGTFTVDSRSFAHVGGRPNVFSGKPHSVYIPCSPATASLARRAAGGRCPSAPSDLAARPTSSARTG